MACTLMRSHRAVSFGCFAALCLQLWSEASATPGQWKQKEDEQGRKVQQLEIQAPVMTEEDQYGYIMPDRYRCDSCRAVFYHLKEALARRQPKSRRLQEWERQEIFEETCKNGFKGYGIKFINGENALSGPAFMQQHSELSPGMGAIQMGGESWERRLGEICRKLVFDDIGEDEVYELFRTGQLSDEQCRISGRACDATAPRRPEKKPKAKAKAESTSKTKKTKASSVTTDDQIDAGTFLASLAKLRGHPDVAQFSGKHDRKRWEELVLQAADWLRKEARAGRNGTEVVGV